MAARTSSQIVLIGCGNVGYHLGKRLAEKDQSIVQVFSRTQKKAKRLAKAIDCAFTTQLSEIVPTAQLYILAVSDRAIPEIAAVLQSIIPQNALVVHTSGATSGKVLKPYFKHYGNFYPLQTFSISKAVDFTKIPVCIHANRKASRTRLHQLALQISTLVYEIDDAQRAILHVAAVFVNNFTNHLFHIGQDILDRENIPFDLLRPLIQETAAKVQNHNAKDMQTGPAIRKDQNTIQQHLIFLDKHPDFQKLYLLLTQSIQSKTK